MPNVIVYKSSGPHPMSPGHVLTLGEGGNFDTVTERWYHGAAIPATYSPGNKTAPSGLSGSWVCMGQSDVEKLPGGASIITVTWRGLKDAKDGIQTTETRGIRETTYTLIAGIPGTSGSVQGRILDQTVGMSIRAVTIDPNFAKQVTPAANNTTIPGVTVPTNYLRQNTVISTARIYTYPYGWICYSWQKEEPLPGIFLVSAEYRYEHQSIFAG